VAKSSILPCSPCPVVRGSRKYTHLGVDAVAETSSGALKKFENCYFFESIGDKGEGIATYSKLIRMP
jgi:hypothetical protein